MKTKARYGSRALVGSFFVGLLAASQGACGDDPAVSPDGPDAQIVEPPPNDVVPPRDGGAAPMPERAEVRVEHYDYTLDLAARTAVSKLRLRVTQRGRCVELPLRAEVSEVTFDGSAATNVTATDGKLFACHRGGGFEASESTVLGATVKIGTDVPIRGLQVGLSTRRDIAGGQFTYMLSWVNQCDLFGPCDSRSHAFATYKFTVDHPGGTRVLCPGTVTAEITGTRTVCDFSLPGGPTYSTFGLMAGERWIEQPLGTVGTVKLTLYDLDGADLATELDGARVRGMLSFLTSRFGAYPFGNELRFVAAPTVWAGFEHPGNITLAQTLSGAGAEHVAFHEMAHQWAGDQTTLATTRDFVWKEAMAEYLAYVYETTLTPARAQATAADWKASALGLTHHPVPTTTVPVQDFYGSAYGPGPLVLFRQLEVRYSRDAVLTALAEVLGKPRALSLDELRIALEKSTGASLGAYVEGWLVGDGQPSWPTVRVTRNTVAGDPVAIALDAKKKGRGLKFIVRLEGANAGQRLDVALDTGIDGNGPTTATARPGFVTTRVTIDPDAQALVFEEGTRDALVGAAPFRPWLAPLSK